MKAITRLWLAGTLPIGDGLYRPDGFTRDVRVDEMVFRWPRAAGALRPRGVPRVGPGRDFDHRDGGAGLPDGSGYLCCGRGPTDRRGSSAASTSVGDWFGSSTWKRRTRSSRSTSPVLKPASLQFPGLRHGRAGRSGLRSVRAEVTARPRLRPDHSPGSDPLQATDRAGIRARGSRGEGGHARPLGAVARGRTRAAPTGSVRCYAQCRGCATRRAEAGKLRYMRGTIKRGARNHRAHALVKREDLPVGATSCLDRVPADTGVPAGRASERAPLWCRHLRAARGRADDPATTGRRRGRAVTSAATTAALRSGTVRSAVAARQARSTPRREPRRRQRWSTLRLRPAVPGTPPTVQ